MIDTNDYPIVLALLVVAAGAAVHNPWLSLALMVTPMVALILYDNP